MAQETPSDAAPLVRDERSPTDGDSRTVDFRRSLPAIGRMLNRPAVDRLVQLYGRESVASHLRELTEGLRTEAPQSPSAGQEGASKASSASLEEELEGRLIKRMATGLGDQLGRVINATGILLHTNLGRAPLPRAIATSLPALLDASCDLELDLESGGRGQRNRRADALLRALTGAEAGLVVNNNAAAMVLALNTLARDREVVVSRGELVEIGGSFRVPAILEAAGARLVEVGTTNRTRIEDFRSAVTEHTGALLKVHPSNYRISGFVEETPTAELASLSAQVGVPLLVDEGAGMLRPSARPELAEHESMTTHLGAGADLVCGSGDKLLGGPQAGLLVGRGDLVERLHRNPLYRALRPDRAALAALEAVLRLHLSGAALPLDGLWPDEEPHVERLTALSNALEALGADVRRIEADAFVGGGAAPEVPIAGQALALDAGDRLAYALRTGDPAVMAYQRDGCVIVDLRTVHPEDDSALLTALKAALESAACEQGLPP